MEPVRTCPSSLPKSVHILSRARLGPPNVREPSWGPTYESPAAVHLAPTEGLADARHMKTQSGPTD